MANPLKYANDLILDEGLEYAVTNASHLVLCEDIPATYADATTDKGSGGNRLGMKAVVVTGPSAGSPDGRKVDVGVVTDIDIDVTGWMDFQAVIDNVNEDLLLVAPMDYEAITGIDTVADEVVVAGDISADVGVDDDVSIRESTGNNGLYTVASVTYSAGDDETTIELNEAISDATVDGYLIYGTLKLTSGGTINTGAWSQTILDPDDL